MKRPRGRWWKPTGPGNVRPGSRALSSQRRRERFTRDDMAGEFLRGWDQAQADARTLLERDGAYELGYEAGQADERERYEQISRLARAADAAANGDDSLMDELVREAASDDLTAVADVAGVTPPADVDGARLVNELEAWLRDQQ
ncbi:hypothetical protein ABZ814_12645 [Micromonospora musae]|uniref:hypothetical protein n=1 Tax=Micromonospora musae TaxID=1894970 RepID=UPI0033FD3BC2